MSNKKIKNTSTSGIQAVSPAEKFIEIKQYKCANPDAIEKGGPISIAKCEELYFQNYSGVTFKPQETEPSDSQLEAAFENLKGCSFISDNMGNQYLGCFIEDPDAFFSCDCPRVGKKFPKLLKLATKNSTFWNTDLRTPMARNSFTKLLGAFKISITVNGNFRLYPGAVIEIIDTPLLGFQYNTPKLAGKWLVLNAQHTIGKDRHHETTYVLSAIANASFYNTLISSINEINIER
jgi:hypothetical protein